MGAMFTGILDTFNAGRARSALVQSLLITSIWGLGIVSGYLITKFGLPAITYISALLTAVGFLASYFATSIYQLYGFISVITGVGIASAAVVCVGWTFTGKQKSMVLSLQSVGTAASGFMWPYLLTASIETYGLRGTCLVLCGMFLNNVVAAIVFSNCEINEKKNAIPKTGKTNQCFDDMGEISDFGNPSVYDVVILGQPGKKTKSAHFQDSNIVLTYFRKPISLLYHKEQDTCSTNADINSISVSTTKSSDFKNYSAHNEKMCIDKIGCVYAIYVVAGVFNMSTLAGFLTVYQDIKVYDGLTITQSDLSFTVYAMLNLLSRFLPVIQARFSSINSFVIPIFASLCGVVGQLILLTNTSFTSTLIAMAFTGVSDGGWISSMQAISFEILPRTHQATGYGFMLTALGVVSGATGPLFGFIRDESSSYQIMLIVSATLFFISAILEFLCLIITVKFRQFSTNY